MAKVGTKKFEDSLFYVLEALKNVYVDGVGEIEQINQYSMVKVAQYERAIKYLKKGMVTAEESLRMAVKM